MKAKLNIELKKNKTKLKTELKTNWKIVNQDFQPLASKEYHNIHIYIWHIWYSYIARINIQHICIHIHIYIDIYQYSYL
jgi:hypothetical protein